MWLEWSGLEGEKGQRDGEMAAHVGPYRPMSGSGLYLSEKEALGGFCTEK